MCLQTRQKRAKIAKEDIVVYKILSKVGNKIISPYNYFEWEIGKLYKTEIKETNVYTFFDEYGLDSFNKVNKSEYISIGAGFHAALNKERFSKEECFECYIYECIIPKGSRYYLGLTDLVVSNQLIIKKKICKS